jgi:hypothetical protein
MTEWILAHPWMTFFILMVLVSNVSIVIGRRGGGR